MMGAIDRSERCRGVAHQHEYENQRLRLIVADGTPRYLETVRNVSEFHGIVDLVGRGATFEETIQLAVHLRPDLVLMDIEMPSAMVAIAARSWTEAPLFTVRADDHTAADQRTAEQHGDHHATDTGAQDLTALDKQSEGLFVQTSHRNPQP